MQSTSSAVTFPQAWQQSHAEQQVRRAQAPHPPLPWLCFTGALAGSCLSLLTPGPADSLTGMPSQHCWRAGDNPITQEVTTVQLPQLLLRSNLTSHSSTKWEGQMALLAAFYRDNTLLLGHFPGTRSGK